MKRIIILLFLTYLIFQPNLKASHIMGGDMYFEYIGDSTGINHQYRINVILYREFNGVGIQDSVKLTICTPCFNDTIIYLPLDTFQVPVGNKYNCINQSNSITNDIYAYHYSKTYTLPGICQAFHFNAEFIGSRAYADNIVNSTGQTFTISAFINNYVGDRSSSRFYDYPTFFHCVNQPVINKNRVSKLTGDSLYYELVSPKGINPNSGCSPSTLAISQGYSITQPITTQVPGSTILNQGNGDISFTPAVLERSTIALRIDGWVIDSTYQMWINSYSITRDFCVTIDTACGGLGVLLDYNNPHIYVDPTTGLPAIQHMCLDTSIVVHFASDIECSSIAQDGSDFRLSRANGQPVPIKSAHATCDSLSLTKSIELRLFNSVGSNGNYYLYSKTGNDGNTLINPCGYSMYENDTILLQVSDCSGIGLNESERFRELYIPNSFTPNSDGVNDEFSIEIPQHIKGTFKLLILDRWGGVVFERSLYNGESWNGTHGSKPLPEGVYFYILSYIDPGTGQSKDWKGSITLIR